MSKYLIMNLQLFAENDGAIPDGAGNQPEIQGNPTDPAQADASPADVSIAQSELEAKITAAKAQGKKTAMREWMKENGVEQAALDEFLAARKTSQPSGGSPATPNPSDAAAVKARIALENASIIAEATKLGFADPSDAVKLIDRDALEVDEDFNVSGAEDAVKALAKAKPHLVKTANAPPYMGGVNGGRPHSSATNIGATLGKAARERDEAARKAQEAHLRK